MEKHLITLDDNACATIPMINCQLSHKLDKNQFMNSVIAFTGLIFASCQENDQFKENLNNMMGTKDFKRFFTGEEG